MRLDITRYPPGGWVCVDLDRYDGAPDAGPQLIGYGDTEPEAIADFHKRKAEREAASRQ